MFYFSSDCADEDEAVYFYGWSTELSIENPDICELWPTPSLEADLDAVNKKIAELELQLLDLIEDNAVLTSDLTECNKELYDE